MDDEDGRPLFAFQDLDYVPSGFSGTLAPYIETPAGTMRAAVALMRLDLIPSALIPSTEAARTVVCDLGCGDGEFRTYSFSLFSLSDSPCAPPHSLYAAAYP